MRELSENTLWEKDNGKTFTSGIEITENRE